MARITLHWDSLDKQTREEILLGACINTRMIHYDWDEMEPYLQALITDSLLHRSKGTVTVGATSPTKVA